MLDDQQVRRDSERRDTFPIRRSPFYQQEASKIVNQSSQEMLLTSQQSLSNTIRTIPMGSEEAMAEINESNESRAETENATSLASEGEVNISEKKN